MNCYDVIIIGGGLAGLTAALHLSQKNRSVLLIEKKEYPHHKVCGEYVSNEVMPYLNHLGVNIDDEAAKPIDSLLLSSVSGRSVQTNLPMGGKGISRYTFDHVLFKKALEIGMDFRLDTVVNVGFEKEIFEVSTEKGKKFNSHLVIGAYGKRSLLDKGLKRTFIQKKSSWLAVKAHYSYDDFPDNLVALHNFNGGYGGLSKTENGAVNFCYLASYASFQKEKSIEKFNSNIISKNPFLKEFLQNAKPVFNENMTIAQISFHPKTAVDNHILMCGDTAGLIHPLCGNGMAMAIHSAKIASELICDYFASEGQNRSQLEDNYRKLWNKAFSKRLWTGRQLQAILLNKTISGMAINLAIQTPALLRQLIKNTHGKNV